jgi:hypothetical protein
MLRATRESPMWRASGTDRTSRSSLGTTRVSPGRTAARAWSRPGRARRTPRDLTVRRATSGCRRSRPGCCAPPPRIWHRIVAPAIDGPHHGGQCHSEHTLTITRASVAHPGDRRWQLRRPTRRRLSTSCWSTQEPGRCDAGCLASSASSSSPAWPASHVGRPSTVDHGRRPEPMSSRAEIHGRRTERI